MIKKERMKMFNVVYLKICFFEIARTTYLELQVFLQNIDYLYI